LVGTIDPPSGFGLNPSPQLRSKWIAPGWPFVNPVQEETATQMAIRGGTDSRANAAARKGLDINELDGQNKEDNERTDMMGLVYDTDPRKVNKSGAAQAGDKTIENQTNRAISSE